MNLAGAPLRRADIVGRLGHAPGQPAGNPDPSAHYLSYCSFGCSRPAVQAGGSLAGKDSSKDSSMRDSSAFALSVSSRGGYSGPVK